MPSKEHRRSMRITTRLEKGSVESLARIGVHSHDELVVVAATRSRLVHQRLGPWVATVKNLIIVPPYDQSKAIERLAYSPDEVAELLGISRELVHDLLRTGQLGSVKAGHRRLISKRHLEAFLARKE